MVGAACRAVRCGVQRPGVTRTGGPVRMRVILRPSSNGDHPCASPQHSTSFWGSTPPSSRPSTSNPTRSLSPSVWPASGSDAPTARSQPGRSMTTVPNRRSGVTSTCAASHWSLRVHSDAWPVPTTCSCREVVRYFFGDLRAWFPNERGAQQGGVGGVEPLGVTVSGRTIRNVAVCHAPVERDRGCASCMGPLVRGR